MTYGWASYTSQFPTLIAEMCSERDSPLEPFVLPAPGQPELARLICGAHLSPPVLTRKQKRPRVNSLVCDRAAALYAAGPPEALSRMSRLVTQAAERERELARARSQRLKQAARSLPGESVSRGFAGRGALEGYPSHYTSLLIVTNIDTSNLFKSRILQSFQNFLIGAVVDDCDVFITTVFCNGLDGEVISYHWRYIL